MKKAVFLIVAAVTALNVIAAPAPARKQLTPEERENRRQMMLKRTGGLIHLPGTGSIGVFNSQKVVAQEKISANAKMLGNMLRGIAINEKDNPFSIATAPETMKKENVAAAVFIVDDPALPISLVAIEDNWGVINVAPLKADNPDEKKMTSRFRKEFVRITSVVFSAVLSQYKNSTLLTANSAQDLDKIIGENYSFDSLNGMLRHLNDLGVKPGSVTTYRKACMEGTAHAPTNEYQKAVWESVKEEKTKAPTNPIRITK